MSEDQLPYYEDRQQEAWEDYKNLVSERDALRAEVDSLKQHIERLVTEKDNCAKNWYDCRTDLAAAVGLIEKCKEAGESPNRRITTFLYEELCAFLKRMEVTL